MAIERFVGVDLAWADSRHGRVANETGLVVLDSDGTVIDAGWSRDLETTLTWIETAAADKGALVFVDAPLVVDNPSGQRECERQVGQRYGRWLVSANTINAASPRLAGVRLRDLLIARGWAYDDGFGGPPHSGRVFSECYPYTTLVGVAELGYHDDGQRPRYKRKPRRLPVAQWRPERAAACDELVRRLDRLEQADPPLRLRSHAITRDLLAPSPHDDRSYKHREDLIDAVICAWTAALWHRHGLGRCQVLGVPNPDGAAAATIIAPAAADHIATSSPAHVATVRRCREPCAGDRARAFHNDEMPAKERTGNVPGLLHRTVHVSRPRRGLCGPKGSTRRFRYELERGV